MGTIGANQLPNKKSRERLIAGGRVPEPHRGNGEDGDADDARCTALLLLIRLRSVLRAIVRGRLCIHLRAALRFLELCCCSLHRDDRKQQRSAKDGAGYEMQDSSHVIKHSLAIRGFNPGLSDSAILGVNTDANVQMNSAAYFFTPLCDLGSDVIADCAHLLEALGLSPRHS